MAPSKNLEMIKVKKIKIWMGSNLQPIQPLQPRYCEYTAQLIGSTWMHSYNYGYDGYKCLFIDKNHTKKKKKLAPTMLKSDGLLTIEISSNPIQWWLYKSDEHKSRYDARSWGDKNVKEAALIKSWNKWALYFGLHMQSTHRRKILHNYIYVTIYHLLTYVKDKLKTNSLIYVLFSVHQA